MAYDTTKLVKLASLKALAEKAKANDDAIAGRVTTLESSVVKEVKVNGTAQAVKDNSVDLEIPSQSVYSVTKAATATSGYAASYNLTKDGVATGTTIDIPKDMVVESGSVVTLAAGNGKGEGGVDLTPGTYLKLVLANADEDEVYINVGSLIEYVTSGSATGDMVVITVSDDHKVTATITDGTITKAKLASDVRNALDKVTKVEKSETNGNVKVDDTEVTVYTLPDATATVKGGVTVGDNISVSDGKISVPAATDTEVTEMLTEVFGAAN